MMNVNILNFKTIMFLFFALGTCFSQEKRVYFSYDSKVDNAHKNEAEEIMRILQVLTKWSKMSEDEKHSTSENVKNLQTEHEHPSLRILTIIAQWVDMDDDRKSLLSEDFKHYREDIIKQEGTMGMEDFIEKTQTKYEERLEREFIEKCMETKHLSTNIRSDCNDEEKP